MSANSEDERPSGLMKLLDQTANVGTVLKTIIGLVVALVTASAAVYHYFAKTSEVTALQCAIIDQNMINNQNYRAAQEVRSALSALKQNLDEQGSAESAKAVSQALSGAVDNIQKALDRIDQTHIDMQNSGIKGGEKC